MALAFPLALLQLLAQLARTLLFASDALLALEPLSLMILVVFFFRRSRLKFRAPKLHAHVWHVYV